MLVRVGWGQRVKAGDQPESLPLADPLAILGLPETRGTTSTTWVGSRARCECEDQGSRSFNSPDSQGVRLGANEGPPAYPRGTSNTKGRVALLAPSPCLKAGSL